MNVTVFLASRPGNDPRLRAALEELAAWLGDEGHTLIWGGSRVGLMGALAETARARGARLVGIEPRCFVEACRQYAGADELVVTETMAERKALLISRADAIVAFPGGAGTLEEFGQALSMLSLGAIDVPLVVYDVAGFYAPLRALLERMAETGFLGEETLRRVSFARTLPEVAAALGA